MATLQKPTVLVLGASGQIGRFVVQQLDQTPGEVHIRVAARTPERCLALKQEGRDAVLLDLDQPSTFAAAFRGVDRVFLLTEYTVAMLVQSKTFVDAAKKKWLLIAETEGGPLFPLSASAADSISAVPAASILRAE